MRDLSSGNLDDGILKTLWLQRLPTNMQTTLSTSLAALPQLVLLADKIFDITELSSSVEQISSNHGVAKISLDNDIVLKFETQINDLKNKIHKMNKSNHRSPPRPNRKRSTSRNETPQKKPKHYNLLVSH